MTGAFADKLIGMQLVSWDDNEKTLTVKKENDLFKLFFDDSDEGDCCGYNDFFVELLVSEDELKRNPVITNLEYVHSDSEDDGCDSLVLTFFGESKKIITINSTSGSGSGFWYGAIVTVKCDALGIDESVTEW